MVQTLDDIFLDYGSLEEIPEFDEEKFKLFFAGYDSQEQNISLIVSTMSCRINGNEKTIIDYVNLSKEGGGILSVFSDAKLLEKNDLEKYLEIESENSCRIVPFTYKGKVPERIVVDSALTIYWEFREFMSELRGGKICPEITEDKKQSIKKRFSLLYHSLVGLFFEEIDYAQPITKENFLLQNQHNRFLPPFYRPDLHNTLLNDFHEAYSKQIFKGITSNPYFIHYKELEKRIEEDPDQQQYLLARRADISKTNIDSGLIRYALHTSLAMGTLLTGLALYTFNLKPDELDTITKGLFGFKILDLGCMIFNAQLSKYRGDPTMTPGLFGTVREFLTPNNYYLQCLRKDDKKEN